jgi:RNA polymerase sigma-70 factor, ECF subfamily
MPTACPQEPALTAARARDEAAFAVLVERHRRGLLAHCRGLLRCGDAADDLVQETWVRAWRSLPAFEGRSSFRTWLYRIATNVCIDARRRAALDRQRVAFERPEPGERGEPAAPSDREPDAVLIAKEAAERSLLAAVAVLPPRQRAVLVLRDVLRWSARDTAALLQTTVPAVNSALQRARATLQAGAEPGRADRRSTAPGRSRSHERVALERCLRALERGDLAAAFLLAAA